MISALGGSEYGTLDAIRVGATNYNTSHSKDGEYGPPCLENSDQNKLRENVAISPNFGGADEYGNLDAIRVAATNHNPPHSKDGEYGPPCLEISDQNEFRENSAVSSNFGGAEYGSDALYIEEERSVSLNGLGFAMQA